MTPHRKQRISDVLGRRQHDLTVVVENVWDPHNISAVLRSCDAVGIQNVYIISPKDRKYSKLGKKSSASASKWLTLFHYDDVTRCFEKLRERYSRIYTTRFAPGSVSLYEMDLTQSIALVFGNEKDGVSQDASALSDGNFIIPQVGMIQSLNISVACAVTLYECYRQRSAKNFYKPSAKSEVSDELYNEWITK